MYQISVKQYDKSIPVKEECRELKVHQGEWETPLVHFPCLAKGRREETKEGEFFTVSIKAKKDFGRPAG